MTARIADLGEGITLDELRLATRNHGMPLEALRYDVTPAGLHYLLTHYDIPFAEPETWRLELPDQIISLAQLRELPQVSHTVTLECAGNGRARLAPRPISQPWLDEAVGCATWTGTPLAPLLGDVPGDAVDVVFTGADHGLDRGVEQDYQRALSVAEASRRDVLLAYEMNGQPLLPQHGAPVRLIVPGWYGMTHVKWLRRVEFSTELFRGFQQAVAYRINGEPVTRIQPRALMIPPGFPDFMTRHRTVEAGHTTLSGRTWSGLAPIIRVEVSTDDGLSWHDAKVGPPPERYAWQHWEYEWVAKPGDYVLSVRATDADGHQQPVDQPWNSQGMANNTAQRVPVTVRS
ncbi:molybdopterin-dependent oxidoreductase [Lentzea tibetensis]|uniref:Molybdopterin-dependent oxidoreductase n=1 Tax=Lentzea tibetensis TaxID=2591470 RepID=A0A563F0Y8_9PSEU|nr:molybdopterin-dependent oxidoreductase [Lentzea tibetensis]TWP53452.1 molybdopterin-dependent oxidoreductase [Lentzea tibetensis]